MDAETLLALYANINRLALENARLRQENAILLNDYRKQLKDHRKRLANLELIIGLRTPEHVMRARKIKFSLS